MSKETLTEIKQMDWGNLKPSQIIAMDFLLEQVQKLETYVETGTYIQRKLRKQNKRYRAILDDILEHAGTYGLRNLERTELKKSIKWAESESK